MVLTSRVRALIVGIVLAALALGTLFVRTSGQTEVMAAPEAPVGADALDLVSAPPLEDPVVSTLPSPAPPATATVDATATPDLAGMVIAVNADTVTPVLPAPGAPSQPQGVAAMAPPAPPLALPDVELAPAPTSAAVPVTPTVVPTAAPTAVPAAPTVVPTAAPTAVPAAPTVVPTAVPAAPTVVPTAAPTAVPVTPTVVPTAAPPPTVAPTPHSAPPAPTAVAVAPPAQSGPDYQRRGQAALSRIPYSLSSLGYTISFHPGNTSYRGLTFTARNHIEIYVRTSMSDAELTYVIAHEMGHAVDVVRNNRADRGRWMTARGASGSWWPNSGAADLATPAGDFAECFATWTVGSPSHSTFGSCSGVLGLMAELASS